MLRIPNNSIKRKVKALIIQLRQKKDTDSSWKELRSLIECNLDRICRDLNTRQLVSVCDTYADYGDSVESRNALLVSTLANMEKTAQSFLLWRLNYSDAFDVPATHQPRKVPLWDGMDSFHLEIGDVTNNLFARINRLMRATPVIEQIYRTVMGRMKENPTILGTLNERHHYVFEPNTRWRKAPDYDRFRASQEIPPWQTDD